MGTEGTMLNPVRTGQLPLEIDITVHPTADS